MLKVKYISKWARLYAGIRFSKSRTDSPASPGITGKMRSLLFSPENTTRGKNDSTGRKKATYGRALKLLEDCLRKRDDK